MKMLIPPVKGDTKRQVLTYAYLFILSFGIAYVWLLAVEYPFSPALALDAMLDAPELFFIPVLALPLAITLVIHRSLWYGIMVLLAGGLIDLALALPVLEGGWFIFAIYAITAQIIFAALISLFGLPARLFFKIRSQPLRTALLIAPIIVLFLIGNAFYVSPTQEYCDSLLQLEGPIKEGRKHNQCFKSLAIKNLDPRICTRIIDGGMTEFPTVKWCMKDVFTRLKRQGKLSSSACDVITIDSRNLNACKDALAEVSPS